VCTFISFWQTVADVMLCSRLAVKSCSTLLMHGCMLQALDQRRHLLRLWVSPPPPDRPLPEAFAELFDSVEAGARGGIHVPGFRLTTPFDGE